MTWGAYGYRLPIQISMLKLAAVDESSFPQHRSDDELCERIEAGRANLVHRLGVDFGYDLTAWHNYLMSDPELAAEYTYHDTEEHRLFDDVLAACEDQRRAQLVAQLLNEE